MWQPILVIAFGLMTPIEIYKQLRENLSDPPALGHLQMEFLWASSSGIPVWIYLVVHKWFTNK